MHGYHKMKRGLITALVFFNLIPAVLAQNAKRALLLLDKEDFSKVEQILLKSIEKDSINPSSYYVYSRLFLNETFPRYNLDSGYLLILKAIDHYGLIDQKETERLNKIPVNDSTLGIQKNMIDSLAYQQALKSNTEPDYNLFLKKHPTALQVKQAKTLRNQVAYQQAKRINTYQSYKDFMDKYPEAAEFSEATGRYNQLLFSEKTKEGSLASYEHFLKEQPQTPFREIIEKDIFEITTANNQKASYKAFIEQYPHSKYAKKALDYLYYHQIEHGQSSADFLNAYAAKGIAAIDSIKKIIPYHDQVLFPIYDNGQYKFIDQTGKLAEGLNLDSPIDEVYYCSGVGKDFILAGKGEKRSILTKSGQKIFEGHFETVVPLGYGLLKIGHRTNYGVIHRAGWQVLSTTWDDIQLLAGQFLTIEKDGLLGLTTLSGRIIFTPQFQDIQVEGNYLLFEKEEKIALTNHENLFSMLALNNPVLQFEYDDYQAVSERLIIAMRDNQESLINDKLEKLIPLKNHTIHDQPHGWFVIKSDSLLVYDHQVKQVFASEYDKYQFKEAWFGLKRNDKWAFFNPHRRVQTDFEFDSLQFLSANMVYLVKDTESSIYLAEGGTVEIGENQKFRLLHSALKENNGDSLEYLVVTDPKKRLTTVYNLKGEKVRALTNTQINALYGDYFIIEKNGKKGLMNSKGKVVLATYYDAIGKPGNGAFTLLQRNKFGLFMAGNELTIRPEYESALSVYNEHLFVAGKSGNKGFIDHQNNKTGAFAFEKIAYWSDSLAAVYREGAWSIYDIYNEEYVMENLNGFQTFASSTEKKAVVRGEKGYGIIGSESGTIINPTFDDLQVIGSEDTYLFFCEKHVREAGLYVVVYYNKQGQMIRRQVYEEEDYDKIYCPD